MIYFQWFVIATLLCHLIAGLWFAVAGRAAEHPSGFGGVLASLLASVGFFVVLWYAGAFSMVLK